MAGKKRILVSVVLVVALHVGNARSAIVTIGIEGEVSYVNRYSTVLNELFDLGDPVSGVYVYEAEPGAGNTASGVRDYWFRSAPYGIKLTVGDFLIQSDPDSPEFLIEILNDWKGMDGYLLRSYKNLPLSNGLLVGHVSWQLNDYSRTALSGTSLLAKAPVLEDWPDDWGLDILFGGRGGSLGIAARIESVAVVPEPATLSLLAVGAIALVRRTRQYQGERSAHL